MTHMIMSTMMCITITAIIMLLASTMFARSLNDREKTSPFECGFDPMKSARLPFSTRFFLLAVIFIVFDIEIVLLMPIPLLTFYANKTALLTMVSLFMLILIIGLYHEWMEGSLNWSN